MKCLKVTAFIVILLVAHHNLILFQFNRFYNVYCPRNYEKHLVAFISIFYYSLILPNKLVSQVRRNVYEILVF